MTFELKEVGTVQALQHLMETGRFRIQEERRVTGTKRAKTKKKDGDGKPIYKSKPRVSVRLALIAAPKGRPWYEWEMYAIPKALWKEALEDAVFSAAFPKEKREALTDLVGAGQ